MGWRQGNGSLQIGLPLCERLARNREDQIKVDVLDARFSSGSDGLGNVLRIMVTLECLEQMRMK